MRSERINFLASVTAAAGLVGFIGVFSDWFSLAYVASGTKVVLDFYGTADGTGAIAVAASLGALMFGCAYMLLQDPQIRRITALLMVLSSAVLLISATIGFTRVDEAVGGPNPLLPGAEGEATYTATVAIGLGISFLAGVIATVASVLLVSRREQGLEMDEDAVTASA
jgi:multisubunit Na+/H+ antiporter MnhC subunit